MFHPLLVFDGDTNQLITAVLRPGTVHASHGAAIRDRWPAVTLEIRADSGFAIPALYAWCEAEQITYTTGLATNARLTQAVAELQAAAERQSAAQDGAKVRLVGETENWITRT